MQTGLRAGELIGLKWSDIDWEKRVIHIQRSMEYRYSVGEWRIGEPKSKSGYRDVPLTEEAVAILKRQKEKLREIKVINMQFKEHVFLCRKGEPTNFVSELNKVLFPTFGRPTIPSFISCYTYSEILYFQGFLPFSIFLLHKSLHNF